MKTLFENFRKFVNEEVRDTYGSEVEDRYARSRKASIYEENDKVSPDQAIADEGGALGFSKWEELTGMSREELEKYVEDNDHVEIHKHGDIIDTDGLNEDMEITEDVVVNEDEICAAGKEWAKDNYDKWPSAYASMGASKKCKELGHKKDESLQEAELDECWSTHERVPGTKKGAPGSCRPKGSAKKEGMEIEEGELKKWRDENWTQSDGTPCGDSKAQKNPKRCKPAAKWATMSKGEKDADDAKKKAGGKRGKQFVAATKKGKVKGYSENMKITKSQLNQIILEELDALIAEQEFFEVDAKDVNEEYCPVCRKAQELEEKKKKPCKPSKGKRFAKRVDGKCRSFGQSGKAKGGGDRIRPGTKKGDAYCARSAGIKKCKNPPCANTLSRRKWKCRGKKSVAEEMVDEGHGLTKQDVGTVEDTIDILKFITKSNVEVPKRKNLSKEKK